MKTLKFQIFLFLFSICGCQKDREDKIIDIPTLDLNFFDEIEVIELDNDLWEPPEGCIDNDLDTYGEGCPNGLDCDDTNPYFNVECPNCSEKIVQGCPCIEGTEPIKCFEGSEEKKNVGLCKEGWRYCEDGYWTECKGQVLPEKEKCDGDDNDCDGEKDEDIIFVEWDGTQKKLGEECGTGPCIGGMVICGKEFKATCSTLDKATEKDLCVDGIDNDCDGEIDEDCEPPEDFDFDGDGYIKETDCNPYKSEFNPKAKEPCCAHSIAEEEKIPMCDFNCDGKINLCKDDDKDYDGFSASQDCNDNDVKIYFGSAEKCGNGIDEDCDGQDIPCEGLKDDDGDGFPPPFDCNDNDSQIHPWAMELCNKIDDNCNGIVDEGNPAGGEICGSDIGICKPGILVCVQFPLGAALKCIGGVKAEKEKCDGLDNNCNGQTDEDFMDLNQPCDGNDPDFCKNGNYKCKEDGSGVECGDEALKNILEVCDGIDNDCDNEVDEVCFPADIDGDGFSNVDDCNDFFSEFNPKAKESCCAHSIAEEEKIHKCDFNCDGKINLCKDDDKDFDGFSASQDCNNNDAKIFPGAPEKCGNGIDENCDNFDPPCEQVVDKDKDEYPILDDCNDSNAEIYPWAMELCNFIDDDCDGVIDDGDPQSSDIPCGSSKGACKPGKMHCVHYPPFNAKVVCVPKQWAVPELCDNLDNDCDGEIDEDFLELGKECDGPDTDLCPRGTYTCKPDGSGIECVNELIENIEEICDFFDNDCDGEINDGMVYDGKKPGEPCKGLGECGEGVVECSKDKKSAICSTNFGGSKSQSKPEECDGLDNDCDGETDEGIPFEKSTCKKTGVCIPFLINAQCVNGAWNCDYSKIFTYEEKEVSCDGLDNDCDGKVDNVPIEKSPCKFTGVCAPELVVAECKNGSWICDYSKIPLYEEKEKSCDGFDNNCDGVIDELWTEKGKKCEGKYTDFCFTGIFKCKADKSGIECKDDIPCAPQASCMKSQNDTSPDICVCGDKACTINHGNKCFENQCLCFDAPSCNPPKTFCSPIKKTCVE